MRILQINSFFPDEFHGGAERVAADLAEGFLARGHEPFFLATPLGDRHGDSRSVSVSPFSVRRPSPGANVVTKSVWHALDTSNPVSAARVANAALKLKPDIVQIHNASGFSLSVYSALKKKMPGVPLVQTLHDYWCLCFRGTLRGAGGEPCRNIVCSIRELAARRSLENVDAVIAPSQYLRDVFLGKRALPAEKFSVIANGVVEGADEISRISWGGPLKVAYVGQLAAHKGVEQLLRAASLLDTERVQITIAGTGPLSEEVRKNESVEYLGRVSESRKRRLLMGSHYLIVPSLWPENNPVIILEALACGTPVIATRMGGVPEIIQSSGVLLDSPDPHNLAHILHNLSEREDSWTKFQSGAEREFHRFHRSRMIDDYLRLYERLRRGDFG